MNVIFKNKLNVNNFNIIFNNLFIKLFIFIVLNKVIIIINLLLGIGDWGLGIGQSPIPNPQSPNNSNYFLCFKITNN